ncbi:MAG: DNA-processing protein DprA, partial [Chloroflexota bacterium]|nr:DNA-processing protein DprA [Chloroflexota bacterium]
EHEALAVLATVAGLGPVTLGHLLVALGSARNVLEVGRASGAVPVLIAASRDLDGLARAMPQDVATSLAEAARKTDAILARLARAGVRFVTFDDDAYPARLRAIEIPPHVLFVRGDVAALSARRSVAVVGTRRPSDAGRRVAARIAAALARAGAMVVSGLAVGIDGAAHAAVVAERGITVAVLGSGHDRLFPPGHRRLADAILASGGAIVSEFPPEVEPTAGTFPRRNRVISGLADATIVVEAGARSGALLTANWALEQGRECFVVPGAIDSPASAGCLAYLREFPGQARIVAGVPQLLEDLDFVDLPDPLDGAALAPPVAAVLVELGEGARRVAAALVRDLATVDEIVAATTMPIAAVLGALTLLEARGLVVGSYGRYRPAGRLAAAPIAG